MDLLRGKGDIKIICGDFLILKQVSGRIYKSLNLCQSGFKFNDVCSTIGFRISILKHFCHIKQLSYLQITSIQYHHYHMKPLYIKASVTILKTIYR